MALLPVMTAAQDQETEAVWREFAAGLLAGTITADRVRPYYPELRDPLLHFLEDFRRNARPEEWKAKPELHRVGGQIHGIISLTGSDGKKAPFCFTLLIEDSRWYFQHVESIFIRLDQTGPLPASRFPDVSEAQKAWIREERRATEQIRVYNLLVKEKDRDFALRFFQDGAGYALEARTWVPFVSPSRAFILFLCWEQANLFASPVTLESLDDNSAVVRLQPRWFKLYRQTGHLRQMISEAEFRGIFEAMWHDRAQAAGWTLLLEQDRDDWVFRFKR
jgi:hypothetical protein